MTSITAFALMKEGARVPHGEVVIGIGILFMAQAAFTLALHFLAKNRLLRNVSLQLNLLVLALLSMVLLKSLLNQMHPYIWDGLAAAAVFLTLLIGLRLADAFIFDVLAPKRNRPPVPMVLRDLGRWTLSLIALVLSVRTFFPGVNLSVLAVSSLVAGYILGNATQDTLSHLVAGLALNTEAPFQIGDWVTVGGNTGVIVNTTWRATTLRTKADDYIVIPNASIGREPITNYSRPTRNHGCYGHIIVDYMNAPNKVRAAILDALAGIPDVLKTPPPEVQMAGYSNNVLNFTIKYFVADFGRMDPIQSLVMDRMWYALKRAGVPLPYPRSDVYLTSAPSEARQEREALHLSALDVFGHVDLFASLSKDELVRLADSAQLLPFATGEALCRQGDAGDSFYIIRSGRVAISVTGTDGNAVPVAHLGAGAFFGEMSLLTGETRSATVIAETDVNVWRVSKVDFADLLKVHAGLAGMLASVLEKRVAERTARVTSAPGTPTAPVTQTALAARILKFFDVG